MRDLSMDFIYFSLIHLCVLFFAFMLYQSYRWRKLKRKRRIIREQTLADETAAIENTQNE